MKDFFSVVGIILLVIVGAFLAVGFVGWLVMLGVGILAGSGVVGGTLGWQDAWWFGLILTTILGFIKADTSS